MSVKEGVVMKRRFAIVVLAILLLAAFCTTVVVAKPSEKSPVAQFELVIDNPDGTSGTGKITVDQNEDWYVFNGKRLTPGETYSLFINGEVLNAGTADADGKLHLEGTCTMTVETVTVTIVTLKQSAFSWSGCGYASNYDGLVLYIFFDGYLKGPDGEPIPGATIDLYLEDKVTLLTDDALNTRTMTTDANGRWYIGYTWDFYVTHYGWMWSGPGSEVTNHVALYFAGNDQYSEAWSSPAPT
jgi:hypothetical protein